MGERLGCGKVDGGVAIFLRPARPGPRHVGSVLLTNLSQLASASPSSDTCKCVQTGSSTLPGDESVSEGSRVSEGGEGPWVCMTLPTGVPGVMSPRVGESTLLVGVGLTPHMRSHSVSNEDESMGSGWDP